MGHHAFFGLYKRALAGWKVNAPGRNGCERQKACPVVEASRYATAPTLPGKGQAEYYHDDADKSFAEGS